MLPSQPLSRRRAIAASISLLAGPAIAPPLAFADPITARKFTLDLRCGSVGIRAGGRDAIELAHQVGFESVTPEPGYLGRLSDSELDELLEQMKRWNLVWGAAGMSVDFRGDEATFRAGLKELPTAAAAVRRAGGTRFGTWLRPSHDELTYLANFRRHVRRLRECGKVLADHGQRFGLEYVGPKTSWTAGRHSFIHTMAETKELLAEIDLENMGFVLDSWHWYTAHESVDDLRTLSNQDIVACDLNDAPAGLEIDQQIDNQRELPCATGVIDLRTFLGELAKIGYDGPIRAEPFNQTLNQMDDEAAAEATANSLKKAFALIEN